ncbi:MAG TPA: hypothetical protein DDZ80_21835 [Cyanobacteria bacterium UBA8803]|nr:hypothetical protein [Cyanobacteria bacterium UBA9273]HBL60974.1 hypothetical protein [Cyanobacteria bacterium UBA8803]
MGLPHFGSNLLRSEHSPIYKYTVHLTPYQKLSEELQRENQVLTERVKLLEAQLEKQKLIKNIN